MQPAGTTPKVVRIRKLEVDLHTGDLWKNGVRTKLPEQPRQILAILVDNAGKLVTRETVRKTLWPRDTFVDFEHSLNTAMMRLREALGDSPEHPRFIETLPRRGYRLVAPVEPLEPGVADAAPTVPRPTNQSNPPIATLDAPAQFAELARSNWIARLQRPVLLGGIMAGCLAAMAIFTFRQLQNASAMEANTERIRSVVVLPLENLSADKDQEYFADGMTDELIARLATVSSLRVLSRTTAMAYKGTHKSLQQIGRELNVGAVVEGAVVRSGQQVRITAELVQVSTDRHLWAETYERSIGDSLALQNQVATAIVNAIRIQLTPAEQQQLATSRPVSANSYEDYLKGRYYYSNNRSSEGLTKAIEYFQRATEEDPGNALAYSGLANCYATIGSTLVGTMPSIEAASKARAAALRAMQIDSNLAEAQVALSTVGIKYDWDWAQSAKGFQRAIELNPSYSTAYQRYSLYLMAMGRTQESVSLINRARELDPLSVSVNFSLGWRLYMARQYDQAIEQLRNTIELEPNFAVAHLILGQSYEQKGLHELGIPELRKAAAISGNTPLTLSGLGHAYARMGRKNEAQTVLTQLLHPSNKNYVSPFYVAVVYEGLGKQAEAMDWLDKAFESRSNGLILLKVDPQLDGLRGNPRFRALQRKLNLPD
jgi:TolB-like protein/DNA-binding winged helix-turn-helix (wHTH) protein/cytochrome c-type biogenesis protein CcmH/NrfG